MSTLRPEDVTSHGLPVAMRGYDKERVDRLLARVAEAYALTWQQSQALRERLRSLEAELDAAEGDARASAKSVSELVQRSATAEDQLTQIGVARDELGVRLERSESERKQAVGDLREMTERASDLDRRVEAFEDAQRRRGQNGAEVPRPAVTDGEATLLLVAAARAAEDVRAASRERALRTLTKARERALQLHAEAELERQALAEVQERRERVEQEADEILAGARAEAERVNASIEDERRRVRELLTGALAALDTGESPQSDDLLLDLASRVREAGEADSGEVRGPDPSL
jgi:DivIVA domain-containing protein